MAVSGAAAKVSDIKEGSVQFVANKTKAVAELERVQQGVEFMKKKTTEISESERLKKGREIAGQGLEKAKATAGAVGVKVQEGYDKAKEKTQQGIEYAKDKTRAVREGAGGVWEKGRGSISRVRANVGSLAWRGSARDTLDIAAREEQWRDIKVNGAEELTVPARTEHTCCFHVAKGATLRWTFRVKDNDIGFGVRIRVQEFGGSREEEVLAVERYDNTDTISGSWVADENRTLVLVFDNRYSRLRGKTVAYVVGTEKPPSFAEPTSHASAATGGYPGGQPAAPAATSVAPAAPAEAPATAAAAAHSLHAATTAASAPASVADAPMAAATQTLSQPAAPPSVSPAATPVVAPAAESASEVGPATSESQRAII